jgi:hypothetical protein
MTTTVPAAMAATGLLLAATTVTAVTAALASVRAPAPRLRAFTRFLVARSWVVVALTTLALVV